MAACVALLLALGRSLAPVAATQVPTQQIRVRESQTLWGLAAEHRVPGLSTAQTVELIMAENRMDTAQLRQDQVILVPARQDSTPQVALR